ncbi:MAG: hypothetical protein LBR79_03095 [Oscillospiraceae bacterium]|nr:hypothetical protein [Oscillospiraceae bacterium]
MYFLPAVGWEKVIKIRRFSNETAIVVLLKKNEFVRTVSPLQRRRKSEKIRHFSMMLAIKQ